jgi:hypothetical protein
MLLLLKARNGHTMCPVAPAPVSSCVLHRCWWLAGSRQARLCLWHASGRWLARLPHVLATWCCHTRHCTSSLGARLAVVRQAPQHPARHSKGQQQLVCTPWAARHMTASRTLAPRQCPATKRTCRSRLVLDPGLPCCASELLVASNTQVRAAGAGASACKWGHASNPAVDCAIRRPAPLPHDWAQTMSSAVPASQTLQCAVRAARPSCLFWWVCHTSAAWATTCLPTNYLLLPPLPLIELCLAGHRGFCSGHRGFKKSVAQPQSERQPASASEGQCVAGTLPYAQPPCAQRQQHQLLEGGGGAAAAAVDPLGSCADGLARAVVVAAHDSVVDARAHS